MWWAKVAGFFKGLNLWMIAFCIAVVLGCTAWGYEQGQQSIIQRYLDESNKFTQAQVELANLRAKINLEEATEATARIVKTEKEGEKLAEELYDATNANDNVGCVSDDQLRIYQDIAGRTFPDK